jgi:signal transduction histidine kinase
MIVPLVVRGRTFGAISLVAAESGRTFNTRDLEMAEKLGRHAGLAIENARLFEEAQRASRMREEILAVVSHDLRNPLGAIHLAATMMLDHPEPPARRHLETIQRAADRMEHLIGDLLDMGSVQAGRLSIEKRPEDPEALLEEVFEQHESMAREKGIHLAREGHLDAPLCCDRQRILQVFGNLIGNAIKFCGTGDTITLRCARDGDSARFAIADTGPGIASGVLAHVFDPYWSAKEHAKQGTGLGLFISKGIVEAHGGRLRAESEPGKGATFYFTIPLADTVRG